MANAPYEDEPISEGVERLLDEAGEWSKQNKSIPHEQVLAELGITPEEIENFEELK
jgi:hypothetical protein